MKTFIVMTNSGRYYTNIKGFLLSFDRREALRCTYDEANVLAQALNKIEYLTGSVFHVAKLPQGES